MSILIILGIILFGTLAIWLWHSSRASIFSTPVVGGFFLTKYVHRFMDPDRGGYKYLVSGELKMPRKIYVGNSHNLSLVLQADEQENEAIPDYKYLVGVSHIKLSVEIDRGRENFLEAELQAASATISGERIQRTVVPASEIFFRWNCHFPNSGNHEICIVLRTIIRPFSSDEDTDKVAEVGSIIKKIRVVKVDGLTQQQVWVLASIFGAVSGVIALIKILHDVGIWPK
jgi:hypothetical protein